MRSKIEDLDNPAPFFGVIRFADFAGVAGNSQPDKKLSGY